MLKEGGVDARRASSGSFDAAYRPSSPRETNARAGSTRATEGAGQHSTAQTDQQPAPQAPHSNERRSSGKSFQPAPRIKRKEPRSGNPRTSGSNERAPGEPAHAFRNISGRNSSQPVPRAKHREPRSDGDATSNSDSQSIQPAPRHMKRKPKEPRSGATRTPGEPAHDFRHISRRDPSQSGPVPQRPKKEKVYCSNNKLDPRLQRNGGAMRVGRPSECFRQGFGAALYQRVGDVPGFIRKFSLPYEKLIPQKELWYKDAPPPPGMIRATLSQCRQRGWGAGSRELSRRLKRRRSEHAQ